MRPGDQHANFTIVHPMGRMINQFTNYGNTFGENKLGNVLFTFEFGLFLATVLKEGGILDPVGKIKLEKGIRRTGMQLLR